jgi:AcrR family transcriptional regulator
MASTDKRADLINVAMNLFAEHGYHATGIDQILATSGIAKKTLYKYFASKEGLIVATLEAYGEYSCRKVEQEVRKISSDPLEQLLAIFDVYHAYFETKEFHGCLMINAIAEYSTSQTAIRHVCKRFKERMRYFMYGLCLQAQLKGPSGLADQLALLIEGAIVTAQVAQNADAALTAKAIAQTLMSSAKKEMPKQS